MHKLLFKLILALLLLSANKLQGQDLRFNQVFKNSLGSPNGLTQDKQGIFWVPTLEKGLLRYDGINLRTYTNDPRNSASIAAGPIIHAYSDDANILWIGMLGNGLERYDPGTNTFTHFRHNPSDPSSLSNDTVTTVLEDHLGNLWIATFGGLDMLDRKTGKFTHYRNDPADPGSISHNQLMNIYEDKKGALWVHATVLTLNKGVVTGALNRFDRKTGKFTRFLQDSQNPDSPIPGEDILAIYEDIKGVFWIGTFDKGLYTMDRNTGKCTRYYPDPFKSGTLGQAPVAEKAASRISFISEDATGAFWIGLGNSGINRYDPVSKKSTHYGNIYENGKLLSAKDIATGFVGEYGHSSINSKDGLFWVISQDGGLYNLNYNKTTIPFYSLGEIGANTFYSEPNSNVLWIGTNKGLFRKELSAQKEKLWINDPNNKNSLSDDNIHAMRADEKGILWLGTNAGLDKFDPVSGNFVHYTHDPKNPASISANRINYLFIDHNKSLWAASDSGISRMDKSTGQFINYFPENIDSVLFFGNFFCITEDQQHDIWVSSGNGASRLNIKTGKFRKYLSNSYLKTICVDAKGIIWAGGQDGLYFFDKAKDEFVLFANGQSPVGISEIINIIEDSQGNIWVSTATAIIKINEDRTKVKKFTEPNGVLSTTFNYNDNYKAADGKLFLGIGGGYYSFYPDKIKDSSIAPLLTITGFKLGGKEIITESGGLLTEPIFQTSEIRLHHNQNAFSFDFFAVDYINPGEKKYLFMLENYDDTWHDIGAAHHASFFNVPPGRYTFRVKVISEDGGSVEKSISIIISPPWWKTWWAYCLYVLFLVIAGFLIYKYQRYYIIKKERERTQAKELVQAREIEKAYTALKATQTQLIQSEKMASLGELTAGIAHEIQNPLNFVNNFSEVNKELLVEMKEELEKGNISEATGLANDVIDNEEKIIFHGKRADAIVKGMLQHSRSSSATKELTDINKLADEYLRLAYHGLRAKDKSFNAEMKTNFDTSLSTINVIPQDIGRVILNLITNAFYAVTEKKKEAGSNYEPTVTVTTSSIQLPSGGQSIQIKVADNGGGIPQKVLDKIFQPFFTTKPTGQGTGLGLSLSYDIITKGHGGEIKVNTKENEGTEFSIILPV